MCEQFFLVTGAEQNCRDGRGEALGKLVSLVGHSKGKARELGTESLLQELEVGLARRRMSLPVPVSDRKVAIGIESQTSVYKGSAVCWGMLRG
jgi:hypothetical protein